MWCSPQGNNKWLILSMWWRSNGVHLNPKHRRNIISICWSYWTTWLGRSKIKSTPPLWHSCSSIDATSSRMGPSVLCWSRKSTRWSRLGYDRMRTGCCCFALIRSILRTSSKMLSRCDDNCGSRFCRRCTGVTRSCSVWRITKQDSTISEFGLKKTFILKISLG